MADSPDERVKCSERMIRCMEMLREMRGSHLSQITRFTLAFDVIYLCALDSMPAGGEPGSHAEHPSLKYLCSGMNALAIAPAQATVVGLMFGWYEYVSPSMPSSLLPAEIEMVAESVYATALRRREEWDRGSK